MSYTDIAGPQNEMPTVSTAGISDQFWVTKSFFWSDVKRIPSAILVRHVNADGYATNQLNSGGSGRISGSPDCGAHAPLIPNWVILTATIGSRRQRLCRAVIESLISPVPHTGETTQRWTWFPDRGNLGGPRL